MQTDSWGEHAWETFAFVAFGSPERLDADDKINYKNYYESFKCVAPCSLCRKAYGEMIKYIAIDDYINTRDGLCYWVFLVHNLVNRKLDKPLMTLNKVIYKYENMRARCGKKDNSEAYLKCKRDIQPYTMEQANNKAKIICGIYDKISHSQIHDYYYSDKILDPKFEKCSV